MQQIIVSIRSDDTGYHADCTVCPWESHRAPTFGEVAVSLAVHLATVGHMAAEAELPGTCAVNTLAVVA